MVTIPESPDMARIPTVFPCETVSPNLLLSSSFLLSLLLVSGLTVALMIFMWAMRAEDPWGARAGGRRSRGGEVQILENSIREFENFHV